MRDRVKPFVVYRRGPGSFTFRPRGLKGWLQTGIWAVMIVPLGMWFVDHTGPGARSEDFALTLFLLCMGVLAWLIAGLWWMFAHAEVRDWAVVLRDKQRERRKRKRQE